MYQLTLLTILFAIVFSSPQKQESKDCCSSAPSAFASLANDQQFLNAHESPLPSNYVAMGRIITFPTPDGKTGSAYYVPAKMQTRNFIFVFHEWWGLNDWIKKQSDLYADSIPNANILAVDLFDGKVATNADDATKVMQAMDEARAKAIIKGALTFAGKDASIATVGWCFGGGWSMQGALLGGTQTIGCVMYYGLPESDMNKLKSLNSDVLFFWAKKDQWINEKVKNDFVSNMQSAGKKLSVHEYDADHAFANPSNPVYDKEAAGDAQKITLSYFRGVFGS
ncbi:MAG TPA: dienelactone hydrolase family protein [Chitinophagales bacterium]|nr:dienelactone hydrolase family protein [Chitinophagales bacterium]